MSGDLSIFQLPFEVESPLVTEGSSIQVISLLIPITSCEAGSCHALWMSLPFVRLKDRIEHYQIVHRGVGFQGGYYNINANSFQPNSQNGGHFTPERRKVLTDAYDYFTHIGWYLDQKYHDTPPTFQQWRAMKVRLEDCEVTPVRVIKKRPDIINPVDCKL